jgi:DNA polymerase zeta
LLAQCLVSLLKFVAGGRWRCLSRVAWRGALVLDLLDSLDLPGRTAELARTFGIDFFSVLNRCVG